MNVKPLQVWLVDDDSSIRWVLEKALKGSGMAAKCFDQADNVLTALRSRCAGCVDDRYPHAGPQRAGPAQGNPSLAPRIAGHRHDRALGLGRRGRGLSGRRIRIFAQAVRHRQGGRPCAPCRAAGAICRPMRRPPGAAFRSCLGQAACHAAGVSRDRQIVALQHDGVDHGRIGHGQGTRGARSAPPQPALEQGLRRAQHRRLHRGPVGI